MKNRQGIAKGKAIVSGWSYGFHTFTGEVARPLAIAIAIYKIVTVILSSYQLVPKNRVQRRRTWNTQVT